MSRTICIKNTAGTHLLFLPICLLNILVELGEGGEEEDGRGPGEVRHPLSPRSALAAHVMHRHSHLTHVVSRGDGAVSGVSRGKQ